MAEPDWQRVKPILQAALDAPPESRASLLDRLCADDAALRREVDSLLESHAQAGNFLSGPAAPEPAPGLPEGRRIGPYLILGQIGRGGMGAVYRAVRDDDTFHKVVALKVVGGGFDSESLVRRFRQERQILARLQHPNIASVLDGGRTDEGLLYLVIEHVEGEPITRYCETRRAEPRERVTLFRAVCAAVHCAHQNLVVHRDLKPDNILVTQAGVPKLLDFGIAKLLAAGVDPDDAPTATLLPLMTPSYASPEQVRGEAITTASDVYSLGVLLYELLAGQRPYTLRTDALAEIVRTVCDSDPPPPSDALGGPRSHALRGDLDTIVMRAMHKLRGRRYGSAEELSSDLGRWLEGRPVRAQRDSVGYRASKFVARHRVGVAAATLVVLSLVLGLLATARQARIAADNAARAQRRFADVRQLANSFLFEFHDAIKNLPGSTPARQLVVRRAVQYLDGLAAESGELELQRELAAAYERLGDVQGAPGGDSLGDTKGALASYEKALSLRQGVASGAEASTADVALLATDETKLARALIFAGDLPRSEELARQAAARFAELARKGERLVGEATALHTLGYVQGRRGNAEAAFESLRLAVAAGTAFGQQNPGDQPARTSLVFIQSELARQMLVRGDHHGALELAGQARLALEGLAAADPHNTRNQYALLYLLTGQADAREALGDQAAAIRDRMAALELARRLHGIDPTSQGSRIGLTMSLHFLGQSLVRSGQLDAGLARLREAGRAAEELLAADPGNSFARYRLASARADLGLALAGRKASEADGCQTLRVAAGLYERLERDKALPGEAVGDVTQVRERLRGCSVLG